MTNIQHRQLTYTTPHFPSIPFALTITTTATKHGHGSTHRQPRSMTGVPTPCSNLTMPSQEQCRRSQIIAQFVIVRFHVNLGLMRSAIHFHCRFTELTDRGWLAFWSRTKTRFHVRNHGPRFTQTQPTRSNCKMQPHSFTPPAPQVSSPNSDADELAKIADSPFPEPRAEVHSDSTNSK